MSTRVKPVFCSCSAPKRQLAEGVATCANEECGELILDPALKLILEEIRRLRRQVAAPQADCGNGENGHHDAEPDELISAAEVARRLGRSPDWVYAHADELGAIRLGDGPRPRLWFDPAEVKRRLAAPPTAPEPSKPRRPRSSAKLLEVKRP